ncbi:MAG: proline--tRNA ligase [Mycoplasma sp.]
MFKLEKIMKRDEDFAQWYTSIINNAQMIVYGAIKGTMVFQPHAWSIWESIQKITNSYFEKLEIQNVALPLLIPMEEFNKEKKHLEGFAPECYLVTKVGDKEIDSPYVIRPTSEIVFCKYFNHIISSYKSLPIKVNQWCSVMRAEKTTRPFLRNSEFHWQELHSVFENQETAIDFTKKIIDIYEIIAREHLCLPILKGEKTVGERFAGAENTFTIESIMQDGQMLQCGTSHYLGTNFAKIYDIKFQTKENTFALAHQMSAGVSTRLIGGIIMSHADDNGLVLPPAIAPIQVKINVMGLNKNPELQAIIDSVYNELSPNFKVKVDSSDSGLGFKLSNGEIMGVPVQIVIGRETLSENNITLIRRDDLNKQTFKLENINEIVNEQMQIFKTNITTKAEKFLNDSIVDISDISELKAVLDSKKIARVYWAGDESNEKEVKELTGATPRVIIGSGEGVCFLTKQPATKIVIFARAY